MRSIPYQIPAFNSQTKTTILQAYYVREFIWRGDGRRTPMFAWGLPYKYNAEIMLVESKTCSKFSSWFNYLCIEIHGHWQIA
jgi:hypothetical protein